MKKGMHSWVNQFRVWGGLGFRVNQSASGRRSLNNGEENGTYYSRLGLYRDNGKGNGSYYLGFRVESLAFSLFEA